MLHLRTVHFLSMALWYQRREPSCTCFSLYLFFFVPIKKVFYFSFSNIFLPNIKSCINCNQGNFIYITHFIQWLNSVVKKSLTKQRDMTSPCVMVTMQVIDIKSGHASDIVLLNLLHTCKMKLYWLDV